MTELAERITEVEQGYAIENLGLRVFRELSPDEWESLGRSFGQRASGLNWAIGDWLVYGGAREVRNRAEGRWLGSGYEHAHIITGISLGHLSTLYTVSASYALAQRKPWPLTWSHHRFAVHLPDDQREALLTKAAVENWSTSYLADQVRHHMKPEPVTRLSPNTGVPVIQGKTKQGLRSVRNNTRYVKCPHCGEVFPYIGNQINKPQA